MEYFLLICILLLMVIIVVMFFMMRPSLKQKKEMRLLLAQSEKQQQEGLWNLQKQMNEQLQYFQKEMTNSLKADMMDLRETTTQRLFSIEKNVNQHLQQGYTSTSEAFGKVMEQMGKLDESQKNLKEVSLSIASIQNVLTDKKTRGIFGEIELYSLLENAFGLDQKRFAKQYKLSNGSIADAVVFAKAPLHMICIDSKFPLENYNRCMEETRKEEKARLHRLFVSDVKKHIKTIHDKYIIAEETAEFAYMFLPAEAVFSYIYGNCEEIISYSYEQKVYLVSPTTLMAYITAIKAIYLGIERNENMISIQQELKKLQVEFERFEKRYQVIYHDFDKCYQDMRQLHTTTSKMIQRFHEIEEVKLEKTDQ